MNALTEQNKLLHPRTIGWFGTTAVAMGGINQSLFLIGALFVGQGDIPGQGSAAVPLLIAGVLLSWAATPGWLELVMMFPNRVGGISASCAEAFRPYSPVLANLTGVCYWWGWVPTCGLTALLSASALNSWYFHFDNKYIPLIASFIVLGFTLVNLAGVKWVMRLAMPVATCSAILAFLSAMIPIFSGKVDWHQALTFHLTVPFPGWFGELTSVMAGLYLVGFAAPAFEQATSHVGETIDFKRNVPRAVYLSAALAGLYFVVLPVVWLGTLGAEPLGKDLALELGPTFAPLLGASAKAAAIWFMVFNMLHGTLAPLAGASRVLAQLSEDGLLPESLAQRNQNDAPWVATILTALMAIAFLWIGDPIWLIAAANLTYLIGIALPNVAVWLLRRNEPDLVRHYRAPRGTIYLGLIAAAIWGFTVVLGFEQFGLKTVIIGIAFAYTGALFYGWRKYMDRRRDGKAGLAPTLHLKLTGAMLLVLVLDAGGYLIAISHVPDHHLGLIVLLEDIFVAVALLTIAVGLILPGMIAHSAVEVSKAANKLVEGTLSEFTQAMQNLAAGNLNLARANIQHIPIKVFSKDEVGDMAHNFNRLQEKIVQAMSGLDGAREGLYEARQKLIETNSQLSVELEARKTAEKSAAQLAAIVTSSEDAIIGKTLDGVITSWNKSAEYLFGYAAEEVLNKSIDLILPLDIKQEEERIRTVINNGQTIKSFETYRIKKNGDYVPVSATISAVRNSDHVITGISTILRDITQKKIEEKLLKDSLKEKESLIKEVHHRVKNNLQIVNSLLRLESARHSDLAVSIPLKDMHNRIRSMALLHESFYQNNGFSKLSLNNYLTNLSIQIFQANIGTNKQITLRHEIETIEATMDQALPCGLILNELVTNSLKHAFPENHKGEIFVFLKADSRNGAWRLGVTDNGVGLPEDFESRSEKSLGINLVRDLAEQLNGCIEFGLARPTTITISFSPNF